MNNGMLEMVEGMRDIVAAMAGVKTMFIEAGFSEPIAELMVLEVLKKGTAE